MRRRQYRKLKPGIHLVGKAAPVLSVLLMISMFMMGFSISKLYYYKNPTLSEIFEQQMYSHAEDNVAKMTADQCRNDNIPQEALCVRNMIKENVAYDKNRSETDARSPTETFVFGGVCRDYAIAYGVILSDLNWSVHFSTLPNHVFVSAAKGDHYCNFDQEDLICYKYGGEDESADLNESKEESQ